MSRVQIGETVKLVTADGSVKEVTVEQLFQRRGRDLASVRFADSHFEVVETKNLNPEPPRPPTDAEIQAANRALDALAQQLQPPPNGSEGVPLAAKHDSREESIRALKEFVCLILVGAAIALLANLYHWVDSTGWIPHHEDTTISAESSWMVGESKECVSYPLNAKTAAAIGKDAGYAAARIVCDSGPSRDVRVKFHGRVKQPEYDVVTWRCKREQDGFTCYELSGHHPVRIP